jgi:hypothetical protein
MARKDSSDGATTIFYAPDGSEYPVTGEVSAVELVNLESRGYSTEKPKDPEPAAPPIPDAGPLSGAASSEESGKK